MACSKLELPAAAAASPPRLRRLWSGAKSSMPSKASRASGIWFVQRGVKRPECSSHSSHTQQAQEQQHRPLRRRVSADTGSMSEAEAETFIEAETDTVIEDPPPQGPANMKEARQWPATLLSQLDHPSIQAIKIALRGCVGTSSDFSGAGFLESGLSQLCTSLNIDQPRCMYMSDIDPTCRQALMLFNNDACVFGDITLRYRDEVIVRMRRVQRRLRRGFDADLRRCKSTFRQADIKHLLNAFGKRTMDLLDELVKEEPMILSQYCYKHKQYCLLTLSGGGILHCAGTVCVDFRRCLIVGRRQRGSTSWSS